MKIEQNVSLEEQGFTKIGYQRWKKNGRYYYESVCKECGDKYLGTSKNQDSCDNYCKNKSKTIKYKEVLNLFNPEGYEVLTTKEEWDNIDRKNKQVKFICPNGHKHHMLYNNFQKGQRCLYCSKHKPVTWDDVVELFEKKKGWTILSKESSWHNAYKDKIKFQCDKGHIYNYTYTSLKFKDSGCPYCNNMVKIEFSGIKKWFEDEDWIVLSKEDEYISQNKTQIKCICPNGHRQSKSVRKWRMGRRCPYCVTSGPELELKKYIKDINIEFISNYRGIGVELDIYIPSLNKAIEFNGDYWHCNPNKFEGEYIHQHKGLYAYEIWERDKAKEDLCKKEGIDLMIVWEDDWNTEKEVCKNTILRWLNEIPKIPN